MRARLTLVLLAASLTCAACRRGHGDIAALRDALAGGDESAIASATAGAPSCAVAIGERAPDACLAGIATWFGSKSGFHFDPPDQAAVATAALVIVREGRGEWAPAPEAWIAAARTGSGDGADALRLAMATRIAASAAPLGRALASDDDARALMRAVAASVPGACDTYARLGAGEDPATGPPERTADHSPCVQKDLERRTGPREHGRYGSGLWRGAEGALALWRDAGAALREGAGRADRGVQAALSAKIGEIEATLAKVETKKMAPPPDYSAFMSDLHEVRADAGAAPRSTRGAFLDGGGGVR